MYPGSVARHAPERPAMVLAETGETVTCGELDERSARLATALRARRLADGDTVAILLGNDVRWGEVCCDRLVAWTRDRIAHVKAPREVHLVEDLPRNDTGKILHRVLVERLSGGA